MFASSSQRIHLTSLMHELSMQKQTYIKYLYFFRINKEMNVYL